MCVLTLLVYFGIVAPSARVRCSRGARCRLPGASVISIWLLLFYVNITDCSCHKIHSKLTSTFHIVDQLRGTFPEASAQREIWRHADEWQHSFRRLVRGTFLRCKFLMSNPFYKFEQTVNKFACVLIWNFIEKVISTNGITDGVARCPVIYSILHSIVTSLNCAFRLNYILFPIWSLGCVQMMQLVWLILLT